MRGRMDSLAAAGGDGWRRQCREMAAGAPHAGEEGAK